jgi:hypothetical protein
MFMQIQGRKHAIGLFAPLRVKMRDIEPVRLSVFYADRGYHIEPQEREVGQVILVQGLIVQMGMDKAQTAQWSAPKREIVKSRQEDAFCVTHNNMADSAFSGGKHPNLPVEISGHPGKVSGQLTGDQFTMHAPAIYPFERMDLPAFQS